MILRETLLQVDLGAIRRNAQRLRAMAGVPVMAVVKADGYGHGAAQVARAALEGGASALAVATVEEGLELREQGLQAPILVLGLCTQRAFGPAVEGRLSLSLCRLEQVSALRRAADGVSGEPVAQLKLDTGMGRIGVRTPEEAVELWQACRRAGVAVEATFTHLATADVETSEGRDYVQEQARRWTAMIDALRAAGFGGRTHAAASAASILYPSLRQDMVREGIALYGTDISESLGLEEALCWKTEVVHLKTIPSGESVSYGRRFVASKPTRVATLPVGYADGYRRALRDRACVLVRGRRAPVIGTICMDQILVDVSQVPGCALGDEAVLLGRQGGERISSQEMAAWADTINYEIMTGISKRVPRVYLP